MSSKQSSTSNKMVVVPCPCCLGWNTTYMDKEKEFWFCMNSSCALFDIPFRLLNHHALIFYPDGRVERQDKNGRALIRGEKVEDTKEV